MDSASHELKVSLENVHDVPIAYKDVRITYGGGDTLDICFRRALVVPTDVNDEHPSNRGQLPPECEELPLYSVKDNTDNLPEHVTSKGGIIIPMYGQEAMFLHFTSTRPFAVKIYAGGINVVSGEPQEEDISTLMRRKLRLDEGNTIQDYIVSDAQRWLDGINNTDGMVKQFTGPDNPSGVAVPVAKPEDVVVTHLQFEIMPTKRSEMFVFIRDIMGHQFTIDIHSDMEVRYLKQVCASLADSCSTDVVLTFCHAVLVNDRTIRSYNITKGAVLYMNQKFVGRVSTATNARANEKRIEKAYGHTQEGKLKQGGLIKQKIEADPLDANSWDKSNTIVFNVQLVNAYAFRSLGMAVPVSPVTEEIYDYFRYQWKEEWKAKIYVAQPQVNLPGGPALRKKKRAHDNQAVAVAKLGLVELDQGERKDFLPVSELAASLEKFGFAEKVEAEEEL